MALQKSSWVTRLSDSGGTITNLILAWGHIETILRPQRELQRWMIVNNNTLRMPLRTSKGPSTLDDCK